MSEIYSRRLNLSEILKWWRDGSTMGEFDDWIGEWPYLLNKGLSMRKWFGWNEASMRIDPNLGHKKEQREWVFNKILIPNVLYLGMVLLKQWGNSSDIINCNEDC